MMSEPTGREQRPSPLLGLLQEQSGSLLDAPHKLFNFFIQLFDQKSASGVD